MERDFYRVARELTQSRAAFVVVTIVDTIGSVPHGRGGRMIVQGGSIVYGTVGGGKVEQAALREAIAMLDGTIKERHHIVNWQLDRDIGMTCGGSVRVYFEHCDLSHWHIVIFGAGHCAGALSRLLVELDCQLTIVDTRAEWLDKIPARSGVDKVLVAQYGDYVERLDDKCYVLLMTMGHSTDSPVLVKILQRFPGNLPYLGVIGSKAKAARLKADLLAAGVHPSIAEQFYCPIGLPLGGDSPAEIAVSVAAQLLQVRDSLAKA